MTFTFASIIFIDCFNFPELWLEGHTCVCSLLVLKKSCDWRKVDRHKSSFISSDKSKFQQAQWSLLRKRAHHAKRCWGRRRYPQRQSRSTQFFIKKFRMWSYPQDAAFLRLFGFNFLWGVIPFQYRHRGWSLAFQVIFLIWVVTFPKSR